MPIAILLLLTACGTLCKVPEDGLLETGTWGDGEEMELEVAQDGTASLRDGCTSGDSLEPLTVTGGQLVAVFTFDPDDWGPDAQGDEEAYEVTFTGEVCGHYIDGNVDGTEVEWVLGREGQVGYNCAQ